MTFTISATVALHCSFVTESTQYQPAGHEPSLCAASTDRLAGHHAPSDAHATLLVVEGQKYASGQAPSLVDPGGHTLPSLQGYLVAGLGQ